jgi:hypothetical protein
MKIRNLSNLLIVALVSVLAGRGGGSSSTVAATTTAATSRANYICGCACECNAGHREAASGAGGGSVVPLSGPECPESRGQAVIPNYR